MHLFYCSSMFDFQCIKSVFLIKNGIDEKSLPQEKTEREFDDQYKRLAEIMKKKGLS